ncbi:MAG: 3-dehydroquinate synthase II [Methanomassiliicoccales archaeon]
MSITVWVRADLPSEYGERKRMVSSALESGLVNIMIREEDQDLRRLGRFDPLVVKEGEVYREGERIGEIVEIQSSEDVDRAAERKGKVDHLIIRSGDWKVIPLENLIADFQGSSTRLLASASSMEEAELFLETLEVGVDGLAVESPPAEVRDFSSLAAAALPDIQLSPARVSRITPLPSGDRVCVDTCSLMRVGEGMLVGSQSSCLFLVASESQESEYVASRPFRVNAGAVHAYVLNHQGKTRYLSEIRGGDQLLAVDPEGNSRSVVVGRAKVERRPLLMIEAQVGEDSFATIVQNAETIRMGTPDGPVSVSDLKEGDEVLVRLEEGGRHFGTAIKESIKEI